MVDFFKRNCSISSALPVTVSISSTVSISDWSDPERDYSVRGQSNVWRLPKYSIDPLTAGRVCTPWTNEL
jgi:hypothetical protein